MVQIPVILVLVVQCILKNDYLQLNLTNITFRHNDARLGGGLRIGSDKNTVGLYATLVNCKFYENAGSGSNEPHAGTMCC